MILEGIVTTLSSARVLNVAPMGPSVDASMARFQLRPFPTSTTFQNLKASRAGVLHVTDDVLLLARSAIGISEPVPQTRPAEKIDGLVLADACRWYEFQVLAIDESEPRVRIDVETVHVGRGRDFFGFNRAKHAVLEAAILATRVHLLPREEIAAEFRRLRVMVDKTGGDQEHAAFEVLQQFVDRSAPQR